MDKHRVERLAEPHRPHVAHVVRHARVQPPGVLHRFWEWAKDADLANLGEDNRKREFRGWWESLGIVGVLAEVGPPNLS